MKRAADRLARRFRIPLRSIDITGRRDLEASHGESVPVLFLPGGATFSGRARDEDLESAFREAARLLAGASSPGAAAGNAGPAGQGAGPVRERAQQAEEDR